MTKKEIKTLFIKFFNCKYPDIDITESKFKLDILIGKRVIYSGLYLFLEDNSFCGRVGIDIELSCISRLQNSVVDDLFFKNKKNFPKCIDNNSSFEEVKKLIFNYLFDFKKNFEETIESFGCMMYTNMYIYPGDKESLILIEED